MLGEGTFAGFAYPPHSFKGVSSSVAHKKGGFLGFFLNMKTARETNDFLRIIENIFIQQ